MITHLQNDQGEWVELTPKQRREANRMIMGLSPVDQEFIEAIESEEILGDVVDLTQKTA